MKRPQLHKLLWAPSFLIVLASSLLLHPPACEASQLDDHISVFGGIDLLVESTRTSTPSIIEYFEARGVDIRVQLDWIAFGDDVDGFRIYRRSAGSAIFLLVNREGLIPAWFQQYLDRGLSPSTSYQYILGVVFADGSELLSHPVETSTSAKAFASR